MFKCYCTAGFIVVKKMCTTDIHLIEHELKISCNMLFLLSCAMRFKLSNQPKLIMFRIAIITIKLKLLLQFIVLFNYSFLLEIFI